MGLVAIAAAGVVIPPLGFTAGATILPVGLAVFLDLFAEGALATEGFLLHDVQGLVRPAKTQRGHETGRKNRPWD